MATSQPGTAPALGRAVERGTSSQADAHLRPGRFWQDLGNDLAATAALWPGYVGRERQCSSVLPGQPRRFPDKGFAKNL